MLKKKLPSDKIKLIKTHLAGNISILLKYFMIGDYLYLYFSSYIKKIKINKKTGNRVILNRIGNKFSYLL